MKSDLYQFGFYLLVLCLSFFPASSHAEDNSKIPPVIVGLGYDKPPYIIQEGRTGYYLDMINAAFKQQGLQVDYRLYSLPRLLKLAKSDQLDALGWVPAEDTKNCLSAPFMEYRNVLVYAADEQQITKLADLRHHALIAFNDAHTVLGPDFAKAANTSRAYYEVTSQKKQVYSFLKKRFSAMVIDRNIFDYWIDHFKRDRDLTRAYKIVDLFPEPNKIKLEFYNVQHCEAFKKGFKVLQKSGEINRLKTKYNLD